MNDPNFRALCAELVNELNAYKVAHPQHDDDLLTRARTLLATPQQGAPSDELEDQ